MRNALIEKMKLEIERSLRDYLREEGMELYVAANDNFNFAHAPLVELDAVEDNLLEGSRLLSEIKVMLSVRGKSWQCDVLIDGIYEALHPHHLTQRELTILLTSLHVETIVCLLPRRMKKRTVIRYIVEEIENPPAPSNENNDISDTRTGKTEYC